MNGEAGGVGWNASFDARTRTLLHKINYRGGQISWMIIAS